MKNILSRAVFLDRDGVINEDVGHLNSVADLRIISGVARAIRELNQKKYRVIVVTNQGALAKGITTHETIRAVNKEIEARLANEGATIDRVYYCPHHPDGTVAEYAKMCDCRKPGTGMIMEAAKEFNIDLANSFLIGDKTSDILAGKRAGLTTILVATGYGGSDNRYDVKPDFTADDLHDALTYLS